MIVDDSQLCMCGTSLKKYAVRYFSVLTFGNSNLFELSRQISYNHAKCFHNYVIMVESQVEVPSGSDL